MCSILSTKELETYVRTKILNIFPTVNLDRFLVFHRNTKDSPPLKHIFTQFNSYCIVSVGDWGEVAEERSTTDLDDVLFEALRPVIFQMAIDYELSTRQKPCLFTRLAARITKNGLKLVPEYDSRIILFAKEEQLFSLFGDDFKRRIREKHEETLSKSPYRL